MTPTYKLSLGGKILERRLTNLTAIDRSGFAGDMLILQLNAENLAIPTLGLTIHCEIGYKETGTWTLGNYIVQDVKFKGPPHKCIVTSISQAQGESAPASLQLTKRERAWQSYEIAGTTFTDVVQDVCSEVGFSARIHNDLANIEMPYTRQTNESDTEFLYRITKERNGFVKMNGKQILFQSRDAGPIGNIDIEYNASTMQYTFDFIEKYNIQSILVKYQDIENSGTIEKLIVGSGKAIKVLPKIFPNRNTAELAAQALLKHYQRNYISAKIKIPTEPGLSAEKLVNLSGFPGDKMTNQQYVLIQAKHTYSKQTGLISELSLKRPQK